MILSQVVKDIESLQQFCEVNNITPKHIIVVWTEREYIKRNGDEE